MANIREILSFNLKRLRAERNFTQAQLANDCGFEIPSYSRWENGKSWPSSKTIDCLANYYQISPSEFYKPIGKNSPLKSSKKS